MLHYTRFGLPDGASLRLAAAMAGPSPRGAAPESDAQYFVRRSEEESRAAGGATGKRAHRAHHELAERYARLSRHGMRRPPSARLYRLAEMLRQRFGLSDTNGRSPAPLPSQAAESPDMLTISRQRIAPTTRVDRKRRQDELLDQALLETFPASDPVSVVRVE